jgi:glutathione synthase/RimK-type ligase-like ATP-grasp enzyme
MSAQKKTILILGHPSEPHAAHMKGAVEEAGAIAYYFETHLFPTQIQLSWMPATMDGTIALADGHKLRLQDIHSVFWRQIAGVQIAPALEPEQQRLAYNDSMSLLRSIMQGSMAKWINTWEAYQFHKEKPLQLSMVKKLGVQIPQTLISNDPEQITNFVNTQQTVIFKPVYGGAHTQRVTPQHLEPERLKKVLSLSPATFQAYIPGTNIRTYVIGESIFSAEIDSPDLDFRTDQNASLIPLKVPDEIAQQCLSIAKALKLQWTAIDWRLSPSGEYFFLEANPSPMFLYFEQQTGFSITEALLNLLLHL